MLIERVTVTLCTVQMILQCEQIFNRHGYAREAQKMKRSIEGEGTRPPRPPPHQWQGQVHCSYRCIALPRRVHCLPPPHQATA